MLTLERSYARPPLPAALIPNSQMWPVVRKRSEMTELLRGCLLSVALSKAGP